MGSKEKFYRKEGLCAECGKTPSIKYYCLSCRDRRKILSDKTKAKRLDQQKDKRISRKLEGLCTRCGQIKSNDTFIE